VAEDYDACLSRPEPKTGEKKEGAWCRICTTKYLEQSTHRKRFTIHHLPVKARIKK